MFESPHLIKEERVEKLKENERRENRQWILDVQKIP